MLKKPHRLKSPAAFQKALRGKKTGQCDYFSVYSLPYPSAGYYALNRIPRFGLIVSKKIDKRAVRRNRIKRRLREILRLDILPQCSTLLKETAIVVIVTRPAIVHADYATLRAAVLRCLLRVPESPPVSGTPGGQDAH